MTSEKRREINATFDPYLYDTLKKDLERALLRDKDRFYSAGQVYNVKYAIVLINFLENNKFKTNAN